MLRSQKAYACSYITFGNPDVGLQGTSFAPKCFKYWPKIFVTHPVFFLLLSGIKVVIFNEVLSEVDLVEEGSYCANFVILPENLDQTTSDFKQA